MILIHGEWATTRPVIAVFGCGMIGSAIVRRLLALGSLKATYLALGWGNDHVSKQQMGVIEERITSLILDGRDCFSQRPIALVWSAGASGFLTAKGNVASELDSYASIIELTSRLMRRCPRALLSFHLISSAGGLFAGQLNVNAGANPCPINEYGRLKLLQEEMLMGEQPERLRRRVYRLSSVYGRVRRKQRRTLIPTLIVNGLRQRQSQIYSRPDTLRDFVWLDDVAKFVADRVLDDVVPSNPGQLATYILASAKPTSAIEAIREVERVLGRKLYVSFSPRPRNDEDITFASDVLPSDWYPCNISTGIRQIFCEMLLRGESSIELAAGCY